MLRFLGGFALEEVRHVLDDLDGLDFVVWEVPVCRATPSAPSGGPEGGMGVHGCAVQVWLGRPCTAPSRAHILACWGGFSVNQMATSPRMTHFTPRLSSGPLTMHTSK